jgi:hypothetical protein
MQCANHFYHDKCLERTLSLFLFNIMCIFFMSIHNRRKGKLNIREFTWALKKQLVSLNVFRVSSAKMLPMGMSACLNP